MRSLILFTTLLFSISAVAQPGAFDANDQPPAPDYSLEKNWSALPFRNDAPDMIPSTETWVDDSLKEADVFYIYPTIYMAGKTWNADVNNKKLNKRIDTKPVQYQASAFNVSARVYAPRYRQSIIKAFYNKENGPKSLAFAYEDVKRAFQYYLENYNHGRPIIIASHSQGSYHSRKLIQEFFDTTALRKQLVAAYVIGYGMYKENYVNLKPCEEEKQTGCYITWASFKEGYDREEKSLVGNVCVNPLSWKCDTVAVDASKSLGAILLDFDKKYEQAVSAKIHNNYLWVNNDLPFIKSWGNLHIADYNLFWYDIRKNVAERIKAFQINKSANVQIDK